MDRIEKDKKLYETKQNILLNNLEVEIWRFCNQLIEAKINELNRNNSSNHARLRAIKKLNKGENEAIDAMCEEEEKPKQVYWI